MSSKTQWTTRKLSEEATKRGKPITQERVRQLCADGTIYATKPATDWLIPDWSAQRWLDEYTGGD